MYVQLARGEDLFNYHEKAERPNQLMNKKDIILRQKANEELSKIFYLDSEKKGKY